jgi:DNA-binding transcriptional ArsR family regulator
MAYEHALIALADPTRRDLLERLARRDHTVGELTELTHVSQPAVSQHLRVLKDAHLVNIRPEGARRYYRANREGLLHLREYLEAMWDDVLAAYATEDPEQTESPKLTRRPQPPKRPVRPKRTQAVKRKRRR